MIIQLLNNGVLNINDYYNEDGKLELTQYLKESHVKILETMRAEELISKSDKKGTVTMFHGTTTAHLNNILRNGLLPRHETNNDNWRGISSSALNVIYLTNKWHYFYAYKATQSYLSEKGERDGVDPEPWFVNWETIPCYIECEIPKSLLVPDEDFFHSSYISQKIKSALKKQKDYIEVTWEESIAHYATVGVVGGIPVEYIKSFSVLGEVLLQKELMVDESAYQKDMKKWGSGKGKGKVKLMDLMIRESNSLLNGTWYMNQIPKNKEIIQIGKNPNSDKLAIVFEY